MSRQRKLPVEWAVETERGRSALRRSIDRGAGGD